MEAAGVGVLRLTYATTMNFFASFGRDKSDAAAAKQQQQRDQELEEDDDEAEQPKQQERRSSLFSRWFREWRSGGQPSCAPQEKEKEDERSPPGRPPGAAVARSQSTHLAEGRGQRSGGKKKGRRYSFNDQRVSGCSISFRERQQVELDYYNRKRTRTTNGYTPPASKPRRSAPPPAIEQDDDGASATQRQRRNRATATMMPSRSTPNLQQQQHQPPGGGGGKLYAYYDQRDDESPPPAPPVRDSSSLKGVKYGPGHEKFPSWPVPSAAETPPALRTPPGGGSHRSKSWTDHTNYPKEKVVAYTRPYMKRQHSQHTQQKLKTVMERCEKIPPETYDARGCYEERLYLPHMDRDGKTLGDADYMVPSPPERDTCKPQLTQADLEEYARNYQDQDQFGKLEEYISYNGKYDDDVGMVGMLHRKELSYAQSEGYHSYVSSTDSTSTPFLDRLRRDSEVVVAARASTTWDDEDSSSSRREGRDSVVTTSSGSASSSETLKWHGSMSDVSVASSSCTHLAGNKQLIAHSARVQTPQRHHSESVLYMGGENAEWKDKESRNNSANKLKLFPVNTYTVQDGGTSPNNNRLSSSSSNNQLSVADRINELERQHKYSYLDPDKRHKIPDPTLKAIQKKALLSFYERHQTSKGNWRSEPQLAQQLQLPQPPPRAKPAQIPSRRASSASDYASNGGSRRGSLVGGGREPAPKEIGKEVKKHSNSCGSLASDLLGPVIVGNSISLDDWVPEKPPERPPKSGHLRAVYPDLFQPQQCGEEKDAARVPSPDLPPPSPPTVLEDEVILNDEPLPPPPSELETNTWEHDFQERLKESTTTIRQNKRNSVKYSSTRVEPKKSARELLGFARTAERASSRFLNGSVSCSQKSMQMLNGSQEKSSHFLNGGAIAVSQKVASEYRAEALRAEPLRAESLRVAQPALSQAMVAQPLVAQALNARSLSAQSLNEQAFITQYSTAHASMSHPSTTQASITQYSTTQASITQYSTAQASMSQYSTTQASSMSHASTTQASMSQYSTTQASMSHPSITQASMSQYSTTQASMSYPSTTQASMSQYSTTQASMSHPSITQASMSQYSTTQASMSHPSITQTSMSQYSTTQAPTSQSSITQSSISHSLTTQPHKSQSSITHSSISHTPTSQSRKSQSPASQSTISQSQKSQSRKSQSPASKSPTSQSSMSQSPMSQPSMRQATTPQQTSMHQATAMQQTAMHQATSVMHQAPSLVRNQRSSIAECVQQQPPPLQPRQMRVNQSMRVSRVSENRPAGIALRMSPPKDDKQMKDGSGRSLGYNMSQSKASYLASRRERERIVPDSDTGSYKRTISPNGHVITNNDNDSKPPPNNPWPPNRSKEILKNNTNNILRRASMTERPVKIPPDEVLVLPDVLPVNAKLMGGCRYTGRSNQLSLAPSQEDVVEEAPPKSPFSPLKSTSLSPVCKKPSPIRRISPLSLKTPSPRCCSPALIKEEPQPKVIEGLQMIQRTEVVLRVNACTTDASSQTEKEEMPPTPLPTRKKLQEEIECEKLSADFVNQLPTSDRLKEILVQGPDYKKPTDYVSGLFRLEVTSRPRPTNSPFSRSRTTTPSSSPPPSNHVGTLTSPSPPSSPVAVEISTTNKTISESTSTVPLSEPSSPLSASSPYFTTSEPKARFLTRYSQDMSHISVVKDTKDLSQKKEELVSRLDRKLEVLRGEQLVVVEECRINDELGENVDAHVDQLARPHEAAKFRLHVEEVGKITSLLLGLSGRLARAENALMTMPDDHQERRILEGKRDKLLDQLEEAKKLKESIDRRSVNVSNILYKYLNSEEYADYDHFINMKAKLIMDSKEIADKIKLGEEQLMALKETLIV